MLWFLLACGGPCPGGLDADEGRAAAIVGRLRSEEAGRDALAGADPVVCFAPGGPSALRGGVVALDERLSDDAAAAKLAHLAGHLREDPAAFVPGDCDAQVARAVRLESEAWAAELRLRRAWGLPPSYPFEGGEPDPERIAAWLWAHPDGGDGVDALVSGYRARCAAGS